MSGVKKQKIDRTSVDKDKSDAMKDAWKKNPELRKANDKKNRSAKHKSKMKQVGRHNSRQAQKKKMMSGESLEKMVDQVVEGTPAKDVLNEGYGPQINKKFIMSEMGRYGEDFIDDIEVLWKQKGKKYGDKGSSVLGMNLEYKGKVIVNQIAQGSASNEMFFKDIMNIAKQSYSKFMDVKKLSIEWGNMD